MNAANTQCALCEDDISEKATTEDRDLQGHVCPECRRDLRNGEDAMKKQNIVGVHLGPYSGNSNG